MTVQWILEIDWEAPDMPRYVGPFESVTEADDFARLTVHNGSWEIIPLARPYRKGGQR